MTLAESQLTRAALAGLCAGERGRWRFFGAVEACPADVDWCGVAPASVRILPARRETHQDLGSYELKGVPGEWRLFATETASTRMA